MAHPRRSGSWTLNQKREWPAVSRTRAMSCAPDPCRASSTLHTRDATDPNEATDVLLQTPPSATSKCLSRRTPARATRRLQQTPAKPCAAEPCKVVGPFRHPVFRDVGFFAHRRPTCQAEKTEDPRAQTREKLHPKNENSAMKSATNHVIPSHTSRLIPAMKYNLTRPVDNEIPVFRRDGV